MTCEMYYDPAAEIRQRRVTEKRIREEAAQAVVWSSGEYVRQFVLEGPSLREVTQEAAR